MLNHKSQHIIYIVDSKMDSESAICILLYDLRGREYIYFPYRMKQSQISDIIKENSDGLVVLFFEKINDQIGERLSCYCHDISSYFSKFLIEEHICWLHFVTLQDRLVSPVRVAEHLRHAISHLSEPNVIWVAPTPVSQSYLWDFLKAAFPERTRSIHGRPPVKRVTELALRALEGGKIRTFIPDQIKQAVGFRQLSKRRALCIESVIYDAGYQNNLILISRRVSSEYDLIMFIFYSITINILYKIREPRVKNGIRVGRLFRLDSESNKCPVAKIESLEYLKNYKKFMTVDNGYYTTLENFYGTILNEIATQETFKIYQESLEHWKTAQIIMSATDMIVVCSGRPLRSNILVAAEKIARKGSVEIQSGTIACTPRFVCPPLDNVLAMDHESTDIYRYLGRESGLNIIDSIRLDDKISLFITMEKNDARTGLGLKSNSHVWMLESQPIGVKKTEEIASIIFDVEHRIGNITVLINMHSNETFICKNIYRKLDTSYPNTFVVINKHEKFLLILVSSYFVFTYFVTIDVKSFAFKRLIVVVNPEKETLRVDSVEIGVAYSVSEPGEIIRLLKETELTATHDNVLTDGKSLDRCKSIIRRTEKSSVPSGPIERVLCMNRFLNKQSIRAPLPARQQMAPLVLKKRNFFGLIFFIRHLYNS